jgi:protein-tyrosine-phosphatase/tRNA A37 threonylcarbamoyladenosine synthetase subunit TsaC/SUA5/YrdC
MPDLFDWQRQPPEEGIQKAIQALQQEHLVVFPTDTTYVAAASAASVAAVASLQALPVPSGVFSPLTLAVAGPVDALRWIPNPTTIGQRLFRRGWPGPLTLGFSFPPDQSVPVDFPASVREELFREQRLFLRCPFHDAILNVVQQCPFPVVMKPLFRPDGSQLTELGDWLAHPEPTVALIINDGPTYFAKPATIVFVSDTSWHILEEGVISADTLRTLCSWQIVFVCTGNTCRSPLAEALCKKLLAEKLGCSPEDLPDHGYYVNSAGLAAASGAEATTEAVAVALGLGADLSRHRSQPLSAELFYSADHILTMTASHLQALAGLPRTAGAPPELLSREGLDIADPIGQEKEVYQVCAQQILDCLTKRLPQFC